MTERKEQIRKIMMDFILGKKSIIIDPPGIEGKLYTKGDLMDGLNSHFKKEGKEFNEDDRLLALEAFHDLLIEKVITPGRGTIHNQELPSFRLHSQYCHYDEPD